MWRLVGAEKQQEWGHSSLRQHRPESQKRLPLLPWRRSAAAVALQRGRLGSWTVGRSVSIGPQDLFARRAHSSKSSKESDGAAWLVLGAGGGAGCSSSSKLNRSATFSCFFGGAGVAAALLRLLDAVRLR